ncbi:hypothetical protein LDENG_00082140 [Lucifuga dentata]|nr:hypothetical protein LDENG_00082140 [Lucifuga dentata]
MEQEVNNNSPEKANMSDQSEGKLDEFNEVIQTLQAIAESHALKTEHTQKKTICAFLSRVVHGRQLDVKFEEDNQVMPLMSAAKIWLDLKDTVEDESLFETISILLLVQSVAVCLEKGKNSSTSSVLQWIENNTDFPQNMRVKLSAIVARRDMYHPFFMSFSFSRLLDTIRSYLDAYLEKNPSDYLLQKATEMVQSSETTEVLEEFVKQDDSLSETDDGSSEKDGKIKWKLYPTKITDVWKPESCKKSHVLLQRIPKSELSNLTFPHKLSEKPADISKIHKKRKPKEKWTYHLDKKLKDGVRRHGVGKWALILQDYDFEGRSGTMLKDRWRVLMKTHHC